MSVVAQYKMNLLLWFVWHAWTVWDNSNHSIFMLAKATVPSCFHEGFDLLCNPKQVKLIFMPPSLGDIGIMILGCQSVPLKSGKKKNFHPYLGPLVHLINRDSFSACPSVTFTIPFYVFTYHIKTLQEESAKKSNIPWIWRIIYGHKLPYMKKTKITLYEEDKKEEASMRCSLLHGSWDQILRRCPERFPGISQKTHEGSGLKFSILMYPDQLQSWLDCGHGLLIFLPLAPLWLSETGQIWGFRVFPGERMEGIAWNFACWHILTTIRTD